MRLAALALALACAAGAAGAATLEVGPQRALARPSEAARLAHPGDTVLIDPAVYVDCAVWTAPQLSIRGRAPGVVIRDRICQGKAIFVTAGEGITIDGITFTGARAAAGNGAGIRAEGRDLTVENSHFIDNENGILAADAPGSTIRIARSEFRGNGSCVAACAHGVYVGHVAALIVQDSRFSDTHAGHHIKSRAASTTILGCVIEDGATGTASYLIDLPNGGAALIAGNRLAKGPRSDNPGTAIAIGAEAATNPTPALEIRDNEFVSSLPAPTAFVRNRTATPARLAGNRLQGAVTPLIGPGDVR